MEKNMSKEEMMKNLTPEEQMSYVSEETVEMTEEAMHKASIEMNERAEEIDSLPRMEAHKLRMEIMRRHLNEAAENQQ